MKKLFPKLLFLTILFLVFPTVSFAEVSKIIFTTDAQSIKPNTLSGPLTIQIQDSSGGIYQTPETLDIQFISTSATGEFLGSTGNPATVYMSKNTANKTFYYKDSKEGTFTVTLNIRGRDSGVELTSNQQIIVSAGASGTTDSNSSGEVLGTSSSSSSSSSSSQSFGGSTTQIVSSLNSQLEILAGSDRTTSPGSPIWFQATVKKNTTGTNSELNWSFGDGDVGIGSLVSHTYKYSGDYVVVLTTRVGDIFSVSRLKVKVIEPDISVKDMGEYLEISNNSSTEINIFNWKIQNEDKGFIFQPNTIILDHSSIRLDKSFLKMKGLENSFGTSLKNCLGKEVFSVSPVKEVDLKEVSNNLEIIKKEFSAIQEKTKNLGLVMQNPDSNNRSSVSIEVAVPSNVLLNNDEATTSAGNIIYEAPKQESLISKLTNFIKRVFSK